MFLLFTRHFLCPACSFQSVEVFSSARVSMREIWLQSTLKDVVYWRWMLPFRKCQIFVMSGMLWILWRLSKWRKCCYFFNRTV